KEGRLLAGDERLNRRGYPPPVLRSRFLLLGLIVLLLAEPAALGCSCFGREYEVVPNSHLKAPLNARVLIYFYTDQLHLHDPLLANRGDRGADEHAPIDEVNFKIRRPGMQPLEV